MWALVLIGLERCYSSHVGVVAVAFILSTLTASFCLLLMHLRMKCSPRDLLCTPSWSTRSWRVCPIKSMCPRWKTSRIIGPPFPSCDSTSSFGPYSSASHCCRDACQESPCSFWEVAILPCEFRRKTRATDCLVDRWCCGLPVPWLPASPMPFIYWSY